MTSNQVTPCLPELPSNGKDQDLAFDYMRSIASAIESTLMRRGAEIFGHEPDMLEFRNHTMQIVEPNGGATFYWVYDYHEEQRMCEHGAIQVPTLAGLRWLDCVPICRFVPAGFVDGGGWRDAVVEEITLKAKGD